MFGNNNIRFVRDGKGGGGGGGGKVPGVYFSNGGYIRPTGDIEINRDTIELSRKKNGFRVYKTISKVKMFE